MVPFVQAVEESERAISERIKPVIDSLNVVVTVNAEVRFVTEPLATDEVSTTVGATVSITTPANGVGAADVTVPLVCFTATEYVASGRVVNVHVSVVEVTVFTQVTAVPDVGVAVKVTVAPTTSELEEKVGVLSFVILSEFEVPESEAASRTGVVGVATVIALVVIDKFEKLGASFPNESCTTYISLPEVRSL